MVDEKRIAEIRAWVKGQTDSRASYTRDLLSAIDALTAKIEQLKPLVVDPEHKRAIEEFAARALVCSNHRNVLDQRECPICRARRKEAELDVLYFVAVMVKVTPDDIERECGANTARAAMERLIDSGRLIVDKDLFVSLPRVTVSASDETQQVPVVQAHCSTCDAGRPEVNGTCTIYCRAREIPTCARHRCPAWREKKGT